MKAPNPDIEQYRAYNRAQPDSGVSPFTVQRYLHASRHLPAQCDVILDVGCNTGIGGRVLRQAGSRARLLGLDCVPERLVEATDFYDEVFEGLATEIPLPDQSAHCVIACELIEHLSMTHAEAFVREAARVLHPKGRLLLTTPNPNYLRLWLTGRSVLDDPAHLSAFSLKQLCRLLNRSGFRLVRSEGTGRVSNVIGTRIPLMCLYGSFLVVAERRVIQQSAKH